MMQVVILFFRLIYHLAASAKLQKEREGEVSERGTFAPSSPIGLPDKSRAFKEVFL